MTARGPARAKFVPYAWDRDDIAHEPEEDEVPFSFADSGDYTWDAYDAAPRPEKCDQRYAELAGKVNGLAARIAELADTVKSLRAELAELQRQMAQVVTTMEEWTADS
jgi:uncharacterized coiled-coil protein SlyX